MANENLTLKDLLAQDKKGNRNPKKNKQEHKPTDHNAIELQFQGQSNN